LIRRGSVDSARMVPTRSGHGALAQAAAAPASWKGKSIGAPCGHAIGLAGTDEDYAPPFTARESSPAQFTHQGPKWSAPTPSASPIQNIDGQECPLNIT